jgi:magnesium chelatase family protein
MAQRPSPEALLRRDHSLIGAVLHGIDGCLIDMQARAVEVFDEPTPWRKATKISGMARGAIAEALDRISGAFVKYSIPDPRVGILINLAPADLPKEGTWLDLPIAIIMLQAAGMLPDLPGDHETGTVLLGEVGLHGELRRVPGALSAAFQATPGQTLIVPEGNAKECALLTLNPAHQGCRVVSAATLADVVQYFKGERQLESVRSKKLSLEQLIPKCIDFGRIRGQEAAKEAALLAAAGGHNLLLIGPPGEGKSLLASALPGILPTLTEPERVDLTRIYSAAGQLERDGLIVSRRPMRTVHHTASKQSIIGGGTGTPRPGEITLAHLGVLFLDELPEFPRATIEAMRQPIEAGEIQISRVGGTLTFPSRFTLVAAMNPCPCGYYGTERCTCKPADVGRYQGRISGPILDRIDLQVEMTRLTLEERFAEEKDEQSPMLRERVQRARERQAQRFASTVGPEGLGVPFNAAIPGGRVREFCNFSEAGLTRYKEVIAAGSLTTRSVDRLAKVARTCADLDDREQVEAADVDKAARFVVGGMLRGGSPGTSVTGTERSAAEST